MADIASDDGYSDDDLDALESEDFLKLQEQALNATVSHPQAAPLHGQPITADELGLTRRNVAKRAFHATTGAIVTNQHLIPQAQDEASAREQFRVQRYGSGPPPLTGYEAKVATHQSDFPSLPHRTGASQTEDRHHSSPVDDATDTVDKVEGQGDAELRQMLEELLREKRSWTAEKASLRQSVEDVKKEVLGKSGEIAVVRSKYAKQLEDQEKRYQALQQQSKDQDETHRRELENARKERERLVTHNRFLDHEMNNPALQTKRSRPNGKSKEQAGITTTPRKQRQHPFADGFEDDEVQMRSPSKVITKPKAITPKLGAKRKRDSVHASPAGSPSFYHSGLDLAPTVDSPLKLAPPKPARSLAANPEDRRSQFLHKLMNHRARPGEARLLEQLANISIPARSQGSLYEVFLDKVPPDTSVADTEDIPASIGLVILELWSLCLHERCYSPLRIFIELISYILYHGSMATAVRLMDEAVNLSQRTADINVIPRFKKLNKNAKVISVHLNDQALETSEHVDVHKCLRLLLLIATLCASDQDAMARFWHCMRFDFISMLLRVVQPIPDIICMVQLLKTCALHDLFSAIKSQNAEANFAEQHVMDRITSMLIEVPRPLDEEDIYNTDEILDLRLELLILVERICEQQKASWTLATHPQAIGRLVRIMNDELNAIYLNHFYRSRRAEAISRAVLVLFHLMSAYGHEIDVKEKLQQQPGGVNKFLITLARLTFSDAIFYEREISEDAFDCAHQMLEDFVTPEEAEALKAAFVKED